MGTGRGNQEVLSEQRQNRGNLDPAPNYNTSCRRRLAYREAILISSGCCGEVLMGLTGGLCTEQLFQTLQSRVVFLAVKREGKGTGRGKCAPESPEPDSEMHKRTSFQICLITNAYFDYFGFATGVLSPTLLFVSERVIPNTQRDNQFSLKPVSVQLPHLFPTNKPEPFTGGKKRRKKEKIHKMFYYW